MSNNWPPVPNPKAPNMPWMAVQRPAFISALARPRSPLLLNSATVVTKPQTAGESARLELANTVRWVILSCSTAINSTIPINVGIN